MQIEIKKTKLDDEKLDVLCGRRIGKEDWGRCCSKMKYVMHDLEGVQYKCPNCKNTVVITL